MQENKLLLTFCLEENSILVNETIVEALGYPRHMQMLVNEETHKFVLRACDMDDVSAIVIPPLELHQFEVSAKMLLKRLRRLTGWADNEPRAVLGEYVPMHNAVMFSLDEAQPVQLKTIPAGR